MLARARPLWPVWAVAAAIGGIVLLRLRQGLQPYGVLGAHYIEHAERLTVLGAWSRRGDPESLGLIDELDGLFPPVMHLLTIVTSPLTGHRAEAVGATGVLWLWGLAAAIGATAWLLTRSRLAGGAAAIATLLLPAAHGFATRYYYDLPMTTLLWLAVPIALATWDRRPVVGGLAVGAIWLAANLLKWPSIPFGAFMVGAAALTPTLNREGQRVFALRRRIGALAIATAIAAAGSLVWMMTAGPDGSLGTMADIMWADLGEATVGGGGGLGAMVGGAFEWIGDRGALMGSRWQPEKITFYGVQAVTTVLSPLLTLPVVALACFGAVRRPRTLPLVVVILGGQLLFLLLWIPVIDERFLLTSLPALLVLVGVGVAELPGRALVPVAAVSIVLGLWVASEFHLAFPPLPSSGWEAEPGDSWNAPPLRGWGIAAGDSVEQRGWSRADGTQDDRRSAREEIWDAVAACRPTTVLIPEAPVEAAPAGEIYWLDYRSMLASMRDPDLLLDFAEDCGDVGGADLALLAAPSEGDPEACVPGDWTEVHRTTVSDDWDVVLLRPGGPCR
jgi:hypothetical protein